MGVELVLVILGFSLGAVRDGCVPVRTFAAVAGGVCCAGAIGPRIRS